MVAFHVRLGGGFQGSPSVPLVIPFDQVIMNIGDAYDPSTGTFTAPVSGVYLFSFSAVMQGDCSGWINLELHVNAADHLGASGEVGASSSNTVTTQLVQGDNVGVFVRPGSCEDLDGNNVYNTFSGHLLDMRQYEFWYIVRIGVVYRIDCITYTPLTEQKSTIT